MGEIADMIMEGVLCEECGGYIEEGEPGGFSRTCADCRGYAPPKRFYPKVGRIKCLICGKVVSKKGIKQHAQAKHR